MRLRDLCQCLVIASLLSTSVPSRSRRTPAKVCLSIGAVNAGCFPSEDMMSCFLGKSDVEEGFGPATGKYKGARFFWGVGGGRGKF